MVSGPCHMTSNSREYTLVRSWYSWDYLVVLTPIYYKHYIRVLRCALAVILYLVRNDKRHEMTNIDKRELYWMMFNRVLKLRMLFVAMFECVRMMCNSYRGIEASECI